MRESISNLLLELKVVVAWQIYELLILRWVIISLEIISVILNWMIIDLLKLLILIIKVSLKFMFVNSIFQNENLITSIKWFTILLLLVTLFTGLLFFILLFNLEFIFIFFTFWLVILLDKRFVAVFIWMKIFKRSCSSLIYVTDSLLDWNVWRL